MHLPPAVLRYAASVANLTGVDSFVGRRHRGVGAIFVAHSIVPDRQSYLYDELRTSARFLDSVIGHLLASGTEIVSLDEAITRLHMVSPRPFACFTFDDGYKDNLTVALPIFERRGVPFTVFVTTCMIQRSVDHWWSGLAEVVKLHDTVEVEETGRRYPTSTFSQKVAVFRDLKHAVESAAVSAAGLAALFAAYRISLPEILDRDALSETDLRTLASSPLVEIGAHTTSHPHLSHLSAGEARREMQSNKAWLEGRLGRPVHHFAYPFGDPASCGWREAALAREVGFRSAVTTRMGNLFAAHSDHLTALPRLRLFSEHQSLRLIDFQRNGAAGALLRRFGEPAITL